MSALLATRYGDHIEMAADGATFDQTGTLVAKTDKLRKAPNAPLVVGGCGGNDEIDALSRLVISATMGGTVDQAIQWLGRVLPDRPEVTSPIPFELVIGCISEKDGPQIWRFRSLRLDDTSIPALRFEWRENVALGPELSADEILAAGYNRDDFRLTSTGMMQAMRAKRCSPPFLGKVEPGHYVGVHVDHAVISASGVTVDRVIEWADVVGESIRA
ncbi:hypothetical protein [Devosia salina]|uniref:Uncharacterized protein n=1 Tax=Devosia salina TaxID=2860336 RepID=A0ABX8WEB8_9HYPH|nr:hypothetical protein [Devosia salina]QYO75336.1 hypothetical protein K1X15_11815 [Devosia salina]